MREIMRTPTTAYILLLVLSIAAVVVAFAYLQFAGVWMYDSNFETFQSTLSKDEARGVVASARGLMSEVEVMRLRRQANELQLQVQEKEV